MAKQPINLRLDADLIAAADSLAAALGTDRTDLIARGLRRELLYEGGREFVYVLLDEVGEVRYVGRSRDPYKRLRAHVADARAGGKSAKEAWLAELLGNGHAPRLAIIDDAEPGEAVASCEAAWIVHFAAGGRLTNGTSAGVAPRERKKAGFVRPISFRWDEAFIGRIDVARGDVPRSTFVRAAVERALARPGTNGSSPPVAAVQPAAAPAPAHAKPPVATRPAHRPQCKCAMCKPPKAAK